MDHYPWSFSRRITKRTVAVVHTAMCIPKQHTESTTRAIKGVESHTHTHTHEVNKLVTGDKRKLKK